MRIAESTSNRKHYRESRLRFQQTFQTPLKDLPRFVGLIMAALPRTIAAQAVFDQVVFDPGYDLVPLYAKYRLPPLWHGVTMEAENASESRELLQAVLSEWIDFLWVPSPDELVIYADHDEYVTFLARQKEHLDSLTSALTGAGFRAVEYFRTL